MPQVVAYDLSTARPFEKVEGMIKNRGKQNLPPEVETLITIAYDLSTVPVIGPDSKEDYAEYLICSDDIDTD